MKVFSFLIPALLCGLVSTGALAQDHRGHGQGNNNWHGQGQGRDWGRPQYYNDPLGAIGGAIVGGAIVNWMFRPAPPAPVVVYQAPVVVVPEIVPYSPAWYAYCAQKYRSWDGNSYLGYDGQRHPCS